MPSFSAAIAVVVCLAQPGRADPTAADTATLKGGEVVRGEVVETPSRGAIVMLVRREWARKHLPGWVDRWEKAATPAIRKAVEVRRQRLEVWRKDRETGAAAKPDDRITPWIDRELKRLRGGGDATGWPIMEVRLLPGEIRSVSRAEKGRSTWLRLGWISGFPEPESMTAAGLKDALEGRGFDLSSDSSVSIDSLLPPRLETDSAWLVRRAATEVSFDPDLAFIRYQGLVMPDGQAGRVLNLQDAVAGLSVLKGLLDENPVDPLVERLEGVAKRGRVGALVTNLDVEPDLSGVTVTMTLWVRRPGDRWAVAGSRSSRVRPEDLGPGAGQELADDPMVGLAFRAVEALGLSQAVQDAKSRSLSIGAATRKALGQVRTLANDDLAKLALPVLDGKGEPNEGAVGKKDI